MVVVRDRRKTGNWKTKSIIGIFFTHNLPSTSHTHTHIYIRPLPLLPSSISLSPCTSGIIFSYHVLAYINIISNFLITLLLSFLPSSLIIFYFTFSACTLILYLFFRLYNSSHSFSSPCIHDFIAMITEQWEELCT